jgi:hypothetical protein
MAFLYSFSKEDNRWQDNVYVMAQRLLLPANSIKLHFHTSLSLVCMDVGIIPGHTRAIHGAPQSQTQEWNHTQQPHVN